VKKDDVHGALAATFDRTREVLKDEGLAYDFITVETDRVPMSGVA
jgi:hypothetical protein